MICCLEKVEEAGGLPSGVSQELSKLKSEHF